MDSAVPRDDVDAVLNLLIKNFRKPSTSKPNKTKEGKRIEMENYFARTRLSVAPGKPPIPVLHVTGTKGKGSTCAFAESILRTSGLKTGLFTSPHLLKITERIRINGRNCPDDIFLSCFWRYWDRMHKKSASGVVQTLPTFFQTMTMVACDVFLRAEVDVVIFEVGIGGRLDNTTAAISAAAAVTQQKIEKRQKLFECAVCGVSVLDYDHTELLGNTLSSIAGEKAGIFRAGVPAFTIEQRKEGHEALKAAAATLGTPLTVCKPLSIGADGWRLGIEGDYQANNAALALSMAKQLLLTHPLTRESPFTAAVKTFRKRTPEDQHRVYAEALQSTHLAGRAMRVEMPRGSRTPISLYLDGAHTPLSAQCCFRWFQASHDNSASAALIFNCGHVRDPIPLLCALSGHKQPQCPFQTVIFCPSGMSRPTSVARKNTTTLLREACAYLSIRRPPRTATAVVAYKNSGNVTAFWASVDAYMPKHGFLIGRVKDNDPVDSGNSEGAAQPSYVAAFWAAIDAYMPKPGYLISQATDSDPGGPAHATGPAQSSCVAAFWAAIDAYMPKRGYLICNSTGVTPLDDVLLLPGAEAMLAAATEGEGPLAWQQSLAELWLAINRWAKRSHSPPSATAPNSSQQHKMVVAVASDMSEALEFNADRNDCLHTLVTGSLLLVADALHYLDTSAR